jgi:hypothetical protein
MRAYGSWSFWGGGSYSSVGFFPAWECRLEWLILARFRQARNPHPEQNEMRTGRHIDNVINVLHFVVLNSSDKKSLRSAERLSISNVKHLVVKRSSSCLFENAKAPPVRGSGSAQAASQGIQRNYCCLTAGVGDYTTIYLVTKR